MDIDNKNRKAFCDMIAFSEGTKGIGNDGYNVIVGGTLFHSYHDHPFNDPLRPKVWIDRIRKYSTASGRYQILKRFFNFYKIELKLQGPDYFSPENQEIIVEKYFKECHALDDIYIGRPEIAIDKLKSRFASFPNANYNQKERKKNLLIDNYLIFGGQIV